jgi:glutathione S-transferase
VILIGQYDSPFVRRVAIALRFYKIAFEHRPWSVFGNAAEVEAYNPLVCVPTLVLENGDVLIESAAILDYLDELAGPSSALIERGGLRRRQALKVCALATGVAEKAVALVYERVFHQSSSNQWIERCTSQICAVLDALESDWHDRKSAFWFGESIGHADIAVACAMRFAGDAHPLILSAGCRWSALTVHNSRCESLEPFQEISQTFSPPS